MFNDYKNKVDKVAMGIGQIESWLTFNNDRFDILPLPSSVEGKRINTIRVSGLAITKTSDHKEWAWKLLTFITGSDSDSAFDFAAKNSYDRSLLTGGRGSSKSESYINVIKKASAMAEPSSLQINSEMLASVIRDDGLYHILVEGANIPLTLTKAASNLDVQISQINQVGRQTKNGRTITPGFGQKG